VSEDGSGDSEDGTYDELLRVIGGDSEGDCFWRVPQSSVGSSFHKEDAGYRKKAISDS